MFGRMPNFGQRKWWASSLAWSLRIPRRITIKPQNFKPGPKLPVNHWKREKWGEDQICVCENIDVSLIPKKYIMLFPCFPYSKMAIWGFLHMWHALSRGRSDFVELDSGRPTPRQSGSWEKQLSSSALVQCSETLVHSEENGLYPLVMTNITIENHNF